MSHRKTNHAPHLAVMLLLAAQALAAQPTVEVARGRVFEDVNANGTFDAGDQPLGGVRVSNGREIVMTDAGGRYAVGIRPGGAVFVIKPRGYAPALDADLAYRSYYLHDPEGTADADFLFAGVDPTGPLPHAVDFALHRSEEDGTFKVALVADPQPYVGEELSFYGRAFIPELKESGVAFAVALGDLVGDNLDLLQPFKQINALTGLPWHYVIGNHDLNYLARDDRDSDATFRRVFGPSTYAFQYASVHFIVLKTVFWPGFEGWRRDGWPVRNTYRSRISADQLAFVESYLSGVAADERVVICTHIPLYNRSGEVPNEQLRELLRILSAHPHTVSFAGHTHMNDNYYLGPEEGYQAAGGALHHHHVVGTASGSWYRGLPDDQATPQAIQADGTPRGYAIATFSGQSYSVLYKSVGFPRDYQIRISAPDRLASLQTGSATVWANVFNGSEQSSVEMRVAGQTAWRPMQMQPHVDPTYQALYDYVEGLEGVERGMYKPALSLHMWKGNLPDGMPPGHHLIEVRTVDAFGQVFQAQRPLWVLASQEALQDIDRMSSRYRKPPAQHDQANP